MIHKKDIAGIVVLYNPGEDVLDCIKTYLGQVGRLFALDNSDSPPAVAEAIKQMAHVEYRTFHGNLGIARALNIGAEIAIADGYKFLLCMDQDSKAAPDMVDVLLKVGPTADQTLGILAPFHSIAIQPLPKPGEPECQQILTAWTSGTLLNLAVYQKVGPFNEEYFIDFVDHEYCMRLNLAGYKIYRINQAVLQHNIGNNTHRRNFLWVDLIVSNYTPVRRYYITRNRFHLASRMAKHFPRFFWKDKRAFLAELVAIFLFEQEKLQKFSMIMKGYLDYRNSCFGKCRR
jgi:rhamnosyltransferase